MITWLDGQSTSMLYIRGCSQTVKGVGRGGLEETVKWLFYYAGGACVQWRPGQQEGAVTQPGPVTINLQQPQRDPDLANWCATTNP